MRVVPQKNLRIDILTNTFFSWRPRRRVVDADVDVLEAVVESSSRQVARPRSSDRKTHLTRSLRGNSASLSTLRFVLWTTFYLVHVAQLRRQQLSLRQSLQSERIIFLLNGTANNIHSSID